MPPSRYSTPEEIRLRLDLEVHDWARILGVSTRTVERWEEGTPPSGLACEVLRGIGRALETMKPAEVRSRLLLGVGAFIATSLTKTGRRP